jgi:hypothetical protein
MLWVTKSTKYELTYDENYVYYENLGSLSNSADIKQSIINAYNKITLVHRPACYTWFYTGQWFACGFIYTGKEYGKLIVIKYNQGYNYILQCSEGQITVSRFDVTEI